MTGMVLALGSALAYGAADFYGGLTNRRAPLAAIVAWSQFVGLAALLPVAFVMGTGDLSRDVAQWGALAGLAGAAGVALLYHGLSVGTMSTVAPVAGVLAAGLPFAWGIATGERPSPWALVGVVLALLSIVLVSQSGDERASDERRGVLAGAGAGLAFGCMYVLFAAAGDAGLWPVVVARVTAVVAVALVATLGSRSLRPPVHAYVGVAATGVLDMLANALYVLAAATAMVSLAAVLASLYPAATLMLARFVLHERLTPLQLVGLGAAAAGVVLIATA